MTTPPETRSHSGVVWCKPDGQPVSCAEKLKVLNENLLEIRQMCQEAFEDALLMGCDERQLRSVFAGLGGDLVNPFMAVTAETESAAAGDGERGTLPKAKD